MNPDTINLDPYHCFKLVKYSFSTFSKCIIQKQNYTQIFVVSYNLLLKPVFRILLILIRIQGSFRKKRFLILIRPYLFTWERWITKCPRCTLYSFYIISYCIKLVTTSWTYSMTLQAGHRMDPLHSERMIHISTVFRIQILVFHTGWILLSAQQ